MDAGPGPGYNCLCKGRVQEACAGLHFAVNREHAMNDDPSSRFKPVKIGLCFSLLTILYAFGLGAVFGLWEAKVKGYLKDEADAVRSTVYKVSDADEPDEAKNNAATDAKMKKVTDKSWVYFKRAHLHGSGLGAISLGICLMLALLNACRVCKIVSSTALGVGSLLYSLFWMFAAMRAPSLGSTGAAKESLSWLAIPAVGLCLIGLLIAIAAFCHSCICRCGCMKSREESSPDQPAGE